MGRRQPDCQSTEDRLAHHAKHHSEGPEGLARAGYDICDDGRGKQGSTAQDLQVEREPSALADIGRHTLDISDVVEHGEEGVLRELRDAELDYM